MTPGRRRPTTTAWWSVPRSTWARTTGAWSTGSGTAATTWSRRYGDCKGKTALLIALLRGLGIEAEAALVSTDFGDGLDELILLHAAPSGCGVSRSPGGPGDPGSAHEGPRLRTLAPDSAAYVVDEVVLPLNNPWARNVRPSDIAFFADGRAAVTTFEGDVWIVDGLEDDLERLGYG